MATEKKTAIEEKPVQVKVDVPVQPVKAGEVQEGKVEVQVQEEKAGKTEDVKVADTKVKIKNISIKLPEDIHRKLKAKCAMDGESTGNVLKRLIDEYIKG